MAEHEREQISQRTKAALAASTKNLGGWRGGPAPDGKAGAAARRANAEAFAGRVLPTLTALRSRGLSLHQMAAELTNQGIKTPQNGAWTATAVRRVLARVE